MTGRREQAMDALAKGNGLSNRAAADQKEECESDKGSQSKHNR